MSSAQPRPLSLVPPENDGLTPVPADAPGDYPDTVDLKEVLSVLRRHLALIAVIALLITGAAAFVVLSQPATYRAGALLRLKDMRGAMTAGLDDAGLKGLLMGRTTDPLLSEIEVLKSRAVAAEVVDRGSSRLRFPEAFPAERVEEVHVDSGFPADTIHVAFSAGGVTARSGGRQAQAAYGAPVQLPGVRFTVTSHPGTPQADFYVLGRERAIAGFMRGLTAKPREQTDVVDVFYTAMSPAEAQRMVNTAVTTFQNLNLRLAQEHSRRRRIFIEEQLAGSDSLLAGAQLALSEFRRRENVYSSSQKFAAEQTTLQGLEVRREELVAERDMYASLLGRMGRGLPEPAALNALVSAPGMAGNPVVTSLYERLVRYGISRDSLTTGAFASAASSPDVQRLDALIASTTTDLLGAARSHVDALQARVTALDQLRARTSAVIQSLPTPEAEEVRLTLQMETVRKIADQLREEYQKARVAEVVEAGQVEVLAAAPLPVQPLPRRRVFKLGLALVMGLVLGGAAAFLREHMNSTLHTKEEVEKVFRAPALATIPRLDRHRGGTRRVWPWTRLRRGARPAARPAGLQTELVTASSPNSSSAEAYRVLRTNLIFSQAVRTLKTVVVTSSTPGEGKTTTAANLAATFAQQGMQVLLVDCDLRRARLHRVFETHRDPGLTHLVLGHNAMHEVVQPTPVDGLFLLPSGALPPNPQELLGGSRMQRTLDELSARYDLVVLDTPPLLATADAAVLAARVDGVLMVVRAGVTERQPARDVADQLRSVDAHVLGVVLNDADDKLRRYGGYYAYSYGSTS